MSRMALLQGLAVGCAILLHSESCHSGLIGKCGNLRHPRETNAFLKGGDTHECHFCAV